MAKIDAGILDTELRVELLRERIYATIALLAVLLTLDTAHTSPIKAAVIVAGTALSLWAAGLVASQMSYRIIMQKEQPKHSTDRQVLRHAPLLVAAIFPLFAISLSIIGVVGLAVAIEAAIVASLLLILGWSLLSARALKAGRLATLFLGFTEVAIGLAIVGLKLLISH